jgi:hypothetical protein
MTASVAGFVAPGVISAYVLRKPEEVAASANGREFTPIALFAPCLAALTLALFLYMQSRPTTTPAEAFEIDETTGLVENIQPKRVPQFEPRTEAYRRDTVSIMGISQVPMLDEREERILRRHSTGATLSNSILAAEAGRRLTTFY